MNKNTANGFLFSALAAILFILAPSAVFAAVEYGAELVDMEGNVWVTVKKQDEIVDAFVGQRITVGDTVETGPHGAVEILFDDGNVTRLDENSLLTIEALSIEGDGSRKSILGLAFGRVKNLVSKLEHKRSRFEVHTKSAVAGVRGTPEWVVGSFEGAEHRTEVDLLGDIGETGSIFVQGRDEAATEVVLTPHTRTMVTFGIAPIQPFALDPDRFNRLQIILSIKTPPEKREEKRKEVLVLTEEVTEEPAEEEAAPEEEAAEPEEEAKPEEETEPVEESAETEPEAETKTSTEDSDVMAEHLAGEVSAGEETVEPDESETGEETEAQADTTSTKTTTDTTTADTSLMMDHITRKVSVGEIVNPDESETGEGTENQGDSGTSGPGTGEPPAPSTTTTTILLNLNFP